MNNKNCFMTNTYVKDRESDRDNEDQNAFEELMITQLYLETTKTTYIRTTM